MVTVVKRGGEEERFSARKLYKSILKAVTGAGFTEEDARIVYNQVLSEIRGEKIESRTLADTVEKTIIERILENPRWEEAAKRYALARIYNQVYGKGGWDGFDEVDLRFSFNAIKIMEARYLLKDPETLRYRETPALLLRRVARFLARVEERYGGDVERWEREFFRLLSEHRFLPNTPTLMNADTKLGILSACFVVPVRDSMVTPQGEGIMDALRAMALIHKDGGGTGFDFSELRPEGDIVGSTAGVSSGPLSFMRMFDVVTDVVKQGGKRRGANMGIMHVWHPDIRKFIKAKTGSLKDVHLQNFNISVGLYDYFMRAVENGDDIPLVNPRKTLVTGKEGVRDSRFYAMVMAHNSIEEPWVQEELIRELEENGGSVPYEKSRIVTIEEALVLAEHMGAVTDRVNAQKLFEEIVMGAWDSGDPGVVFIDEMNRRHPVWYLGTINATNPCGEQPLLPWENCNLGSINLEKYVVDGPGGPRVDWEGLARDVRVAVRFLDNVIDANRHPLPQITEANRRTRKIGLGVMGWAHMLIRLGIPYDSPDAVRLAWAVGEWIAYNAYLASIELAREKGVFPTWDPERYRPLWETLPYKSPEEYMRVAGLEPGATGGILEKLVSTRPPVDWRRVEEEMKKYGLRNGALLSIAPTGTISILSGTSSSIEPLFALAFMRFVSVGQFIEVNKLFLEELRRYELDEPELIIEIARTGSVAHNKYIPRRLRRIYRTAHDVDPEWHLLHQAVWQAWIDAGVSKTINLRHDEPPSTVWKVYMLAWKLGVKGTTVYRDRSKSQQVIQFGIKKEEKEGDNREESTSEGSPTLEEKAKSVLEEPPKPAMVLPAPSGGEASSEETEKTLEERGYTRKKVRLGRGRVGEMIEVIVASEDYAGGCVDCEF